MRIKKDKQPLILQTDVWTISRCFHPNPNHHAFPHTGLFQSGSNAVWALLPLWSGNVRYPSLHSHTMAASRLQLEQHDGQRQTDEGRILLSAVVFCVEPEAEIPSLHAFIPCSEARLQPRSPAGRLLLFVWREELAAGRCLDQSSPQDLF